MHTWGRKLSCAGGPGMEAFSCRKASFLDSLSHLSLKLLFPFPLPCVSARLMFCACRWVILNEEAIPHLSAVGLQELSAMEKLGHYFRSLGLKLLLHTWNNQVVKVQVDGPSCSNDPRRHFRFPAPVVCLRHNINIIQVKEHRYEISCVNIEVPSPVSPQVACLVIYSTNIFQAINVYFARHHAGCWGYNDD